MTLHSSLPRPVGRGAAPRLTIATLATLVATLVATPWRPAHAQRSVDERARRERVERGLLPAVTVVGRRDTAFALAERMRRYGVPGVSIAVIDGGRIAWARGYGVVEARGAQPVDSATLFQAGSISKAVTAVAALRLVERGALTLDEDVNRRLTSWKVPESALTRERKVTLRGLLSHGAGLNVPSFSPGYRPGEPVPTLLQVLDGVDPATNPPVRVEVTPGTEWRYSGGGTSVAQQLLVDVGGAPFATLVRGLVLDPAGMARSTFEPPPPRSTDAATGHSPADAPLLWRWRLYPELAAAGLWSTAPDLARFALAVQRSWQGGAAPLLRRSTARAMLTPQMGDWGLGFALAGAGDSATFGHDGSTAGFAARLLAFRDSGRGVAVMTNGESEPLIDEIVRSVAREYGWPAPPRARKRVVVVDRALFTRLAGRYRIALGERTIDVAVSTDGARLFFTGSSGRPAEILPEGANRYFSLDSGTEFTFDVPDGGPAQALVIRQSGGRFTARRVP